VLDAVEVGRAGLAGQAALLDRFLLTLNVLASFGARTRLRTQHSFPIIRPIVSNQPARWARPVSLGRVFRDFDQARFPFREQSTHGSPFFIVELDFQ
jgi:hypothetical protein